MKPIYLFAKIFFTGGLVLGLELIASRILTPFFGVSLYVWSAILSVTLIALALGYQGGGVLTQKLDRDRLQVFFASAGGLASLWLVLCVWTYPVLFWPLADFNLVAGSIASCVYLLFIPLLVLSSLNPVLVGLLSGEDNKGDHGAGRVFFISTLGSVAGVFAVAYGLLPHMTNYKSVVLLAFLAALSSTIMLFLLRGHGGRAFTKALCITAAALLLSGATYATGGLERFNKEAVQGNATWRLVQGAPSYFGYTQIVDFETPQGYHSRYLVTDGLTQNRFTDGISTALYTYVLERMGLALAPDAQRALVLGIGGGVIPAAYAAEGLEVDAVDINPRVVEVAREFLGFDPAGINLIISDARTFVRGCDGERYDVVALDLFQGDGVPEHLVTREFFSDLKSCMKDGAALVMNSFMDLDNPQAEYALVRTVADVFGPVTFMQRPLHGKSRLTVAFLMLRKNGTVENPELLMNDIPERVREEFEETLAETTLLDAGHKTLEGAPVLTDLSNQWKHLAHSSELAYRRNAVSLLPWQILMN